MEELISIIIPVYKVEKYLRRCLDSVMNQTYKNIEVILVDDGSPDKCPEICDEYAEKDERVKVIHKPNGGLSSARNAGLEICEGRYIFFIDSDDYICIDIVEKCMAVIDGRRDIDAVVFGSRHRLIDGDKVINDEEKVPDSAVYNCVNFQEILQGPLHNMYGIPGSALQTETQSTAIKKYKNFVEVWCWCFRRETLLEHNIRFREDLICGEDEIFTCEFLSFSDKILCVQNIGYEYIIRFDGMVKTRAYSPTIIDNKIYLSKYRQLIRDTVYERTSIDISEWGYGSSILSIFQLCVALANEKHGYRQLKRYIELDEVKQAVKTVPLKGRLKLVLPLALCKCGCYRLVYMMISFLKKIGISVRL